MNYSSKLNRSFLHSNYLSEMPQMAERFRSMVEETLSGIKAQIPNVWVNGDFTSRLPGTLNLGFDGVSGETLMNLLDLKGVCVSTSSACNSGKNEPSHVLLALGQTDEQAKSAIRISYGKDNSIREVEAVENTFRAVNRELISMYWEIGAYISDKVKHGGWGKSVVADFPGYIQAERLDIKGFVQVGNKDFHLKYSDFPD